MCLLVVKNRGSSRAIARTKPHRELPAVEASLATNQARSRIRPTRFRQSAPLSSQGYREKNEIGRGSSQNDIARIEECFGDQVQQLVAAGRHNHPGGISSNLAGPKRYINSNISCRRNQVSRVAPILKSPTQPLRRIRKLVEYRRDLRGRQSFLIHKTSRQGDKIRVCGELESSTDRSVAPGCHGPLAPHAAFRFTRGLPDYLLQFRSHSSLVPMVMLILLAAHVLSS